MLKVSQVSDIGMLDKDSNIREEWLLNRIGKLTSSQIYKIAGKEGFGDTGKTYIRTRAFERAAKVSADKEITTPSMIAGLVEEGHSLRIFKRRHGIEHFVVQKLINGTLPNESGTPDGLWLKSAFEKGGVSLYDAETVETKSFEPAKFMKCIEADKPEDVKKIDPSSFWQVVDQMIVADCLNGWLVYFNSQLGEDKGGYKEIPFRAAILKDEVNFLKDRKKEAQLEIEKIYKKLTSQTNLGPLSC